MALERMDRLLGEVYEFRSGLSKPASEFGSGHPFLTFKDVFYNYFVPETLGDLVNSTDADRDAGDVKRGDVFLTRTSETMDELGMSCVALRDVPLATFNGFSKRLRPKPGSPIVPEYAGYFFRSPQFRREVTAMSSMSTRASLNNGMLSRLRITLPDVVTQAAIGATLKSLDDKIEQNQRTARALEQLAGAVFQAWFVDFEPVKAKAAGATTFPSMPQPVFDALSTRFVDSAVGPVPQGWEGGPIKRLATISKVQVNPQDNPEEVVDHFSLPAYDATMSPIVEAGSVIKSGKFLVVAGCVLVSKLNPRIARVWLPPPPAGRRQIASTEFLVVIPRQVSDRHHLYCQFQQTAFREELVQGTSGTSNSHQRVRPDDVLNRMIIVPSPPTRVAFAGLVDPLFALMSANRDECAKLATLRDYLLPKLLSGVVRVEAE